MAKQSINTLKAWFETGDYPTQQQFWDWLDSFIHKDDALDISNVDGLEDALILKADASQITALINAVLLNAGTTSWLVPAGTLIEMFLIIAPTTINFSVGTTEGGQEVIETYEVAVWSVYDKNVYFAAATTIYFGGVAEDTIIKIFKR